MIQLNELRFPGCIVLRLRFPSYSLLTFLGFTYNIELCQAPVPLTRCNPPVSPDARYLFFSMPRLFPSIQDEVNRELHDLEFADFTMRYVSYYLVALDTTNVSLHNDGHASGSCI